MELSVAVLKKARLRHKATRLEPQQSAGAATTDFVLRVDHMIICHTNAIPRNDRPFRRGWNNGNSLKFCPSYISGGVEIQKGLVQDPNKSSNNNNSDRTAFTGTPHSSGGADLPQNTESNCFCQSNDCTPGKY